MNANIGGCAPNGSKPISTGARFATANIAMSKASGTRMSTRTMLRIMRPLRSSTSKGRNDGSASLLRLVQPLAHFLAGLEERHRLLVDRYMRAGARVAAGARRAVLDREGSEAAQFHPVAARERCRNLAEHGVDDVFDVALVEVRVLLGDALNQFRLDHRSWRALVLGAIHGRDAHDASFPRRAGARLISSRRVPKGQQTVKVQPLDRPDRAPRLKLACERAKAHRIEYGGGRHMQDAEVAEARFQIPVTYRHVGLEALLLGQPVERGLLVAEFVDQLELDP